MNTAGLLLHDLTPEIRALFSEWIDKAHTLVNIQALIGTLEIHLGYLCNKGDLEMTKISEKSRFTVLD